MKNFTTNLRQIITVQESILEDDGIGGNLELWRDYIILSAEVRAINEFALKESFSSMQLMDKSLYKFRIRFNPKIKPSMRILYDARVFKIKRVVNHEEKNTITIMIAEEAF